MPFLVQGIIQSGKVKILATTGAKRSAFLPSLPTMVEAGYPDFIQGSWVALCSPAGTLNAIIDKLYGALGQIMTDPDVVSRWEKEGHDVTFEGPEGLRRFTLSEIKRYKELVALTGAQVNLQYPCG